MNLRLDAKILKLWPNFIDHYIANNKLNELNSSELAYKSENDPISSRVLPTLKALALVLRKISIIL